MATVETQSFSLTLPDSWTVRETSPRAVLEGPVGEVLVLSSFSIAGDGARGELAAIKSELRANLVRTFEAMPADGSCTARTGMQKFDSPGCEEFFQQLFQSADGQAAIGLFGLLQGRHALLATLECAAGDQQSLLDVAQSLDRIEWMATDTAPSRSQAPKKSGWKFWR